MLLGSASTPCSRNATGSPGKRSSRPRSLARAEAAVISLERDNLAYYRDELARFEAALASPPLDDMAQLGALAPGAFHRRATRVGRLLFGRPEARHP
jgi:hypothetical protein